MSLQKLLKSITSDATEIIKLKNLNKSQRLIIRIQLKDTKESSAVKNKLLFSDAVSKLIESNFNEGRYHKMKWQFVPKWNHTFKKMWMSKSYEVIHIL